MSGESRTTAPPIVDNDQARSILEDLERRLSRSEHDCLEVSRNATTFDICEAFSALAHRVHPRRFESLGPSIRDRAESDYQALRQAFWTLVHARSKSSIAPPAATARGTRPDVPRPRGTQKDPKA